MESYKDSSNYSYLNIAFKIFLIVTLIMTLIIYFKIDIFNIKFFKDGNKDEKFVHKDYDVNRKLVNAITKENYLTMNLSDFFIKTAFNCCKNGYGDSNVEKLKTIISQGFRCLDFDLIYKNNTIKIKNQPSNETFYDALEIIDKRCFNPSYCNNNEDPLIINIRFNKSITDSLTESKNVYKKLREMFKTLNSKRLDSSYSMLQNKKFNKKGYTDILREPLNNIYGKIIVMCNYNYDIINTNNFDAKHEVLQYIHINTYIADTNDTIEIINKVLTDENSTYNNSIINMDINDSIKTNSIGLINLNKDYPMMIIPNSYDSISAIANPSSLEDVFGYTFRALEFSGIKDFNQEILDSDIKIYIDEFNIMGSAFILKPIKLRTIR